MIKKLDKLILKSFFGPFIITFFIAFFVLMMQILWKYIDDLVGKGLDFWTIIKFVWYASATLSTLAMPIAILISSIMTFGNLGESFELVAIKSSGISLIRFMRPLIWVTAVLCIITFLFANYVIPYSNLKFRNLYISIRTKKPALDLKDGVFYTGIEHYSIRVGKKNDNGKDIKNVLIYENDRPSMLQDYTTLAQEGRMEVSPDEHYLEFNLKNGNRYQEKGNYGDTSTEYIRLQFKTFKKLLDLSALQLQKNLDTAASRNYNMLSAAQLNKNLDSLYALRDSVNTGFIRTTTISMPYMQDTLKEWKKIPPVKYLEGEKFYPDSLNDLLYERAMSKAAELKNTYFFSSADTEKNDEAIRRHRMEWHRKFSLSLACMVLFFIGAPLGSIIRKGGLGMPLVVAIVFFLIFHLMNMFGEKFAKTGTLSPFWGMWLAVIVLTPVGIFFTYKAMHDSQLFNKELYTKAIRKIKSLFPGSNKKA